MQACSFTGNSCPAGKEACKNTCVLNTDKVLSNVAAEDRAFKRTWWALCPNLAFQVGAAVSRAQARRKLSSVVVRRHTYVLVNPVAPGTRAAPQCEQKVCMIYALYPRGEAVSTLALRVLLSSGP
jgi:hypothetical protein